MRDVLRQLPSDRFVRYDELADDIGLDPWEILWACEALVRNGKAISGRNLTFKSAEAASTGKSEG
jgi:hypothetical protein